MYFFTQSLLSYHHNNMASINNNNDNKGASSPWLTALREQLRRYKAPTDDEEEEVSGMGIVESAAAAPIADKFRPKKAAVLICLFQSQNENHNNINNDNKKSLRVILTKRSSTLSTHSGEVSLPGGKAEEDDVDDAHTATREAKEEIGLDPSLVDVVALLEPFLSKHLLQVIPVIGILSDRNSFNPTPNVDEVDDVFDAPLEMFLKDENRRCEEREWMGDRYLIHYFDYETGGKKFLIWGLTAGILIRAASIVYQRPPAFLEQNPKFKVPVTVNKDTIMP